jgi:hypothetical protein
MTKSPMTQNEKENFISFLAQSTPEVLNDFIKKKGKNNSNDRLFVFDWERLKKDNNYKPIIK